MIREFSIDRPIFRAKIKELINRFARHLLVGGMGTIIYMVALTGLVEIFHQKPVPSSVIAFMFGIIYTYVLNRVWVYNASKGHDYSVPRFFIVEMFALVLNTAIMYISVDVFGLWYIWGQVGAACIMPPTNFLLNYFWAFK